jgi:peptidoglycan/LPS O-acetylase OafA/YrhL
MNRNHEIDGIRGWAAFNVILFHFFRETFGKVYPYLHNEIFNFIFNGHFMVLVFFILSGDALSFSFFSNRKTDTTVRLAAARYFRLTFPILVSCMLIWLAMRMNLTFNIEASAIVDRKVWLGSFINFKQSFLSALQYSLEGVYFHNSEGRVYNPFLWTMPIEFLGSLIVFMNIFILQRQKNALLILIPQALFFLYFSEYYFLFISGMILGYLRSINLFKTIHEMKLNWMLLPLFLFLAFFVFNFHLEQAETIFNMVTLGLVDSDSLLLVFALMIVFLCYSSNALVKFFSTRFSRFLGDISFPLYVFQFNVLVTITSFMIVHFNKNGLLVNGLYWMIIPIISILATIAIATVFRMVERKYLQGINALIAQNTVEEEQR